MKKIKPSTKNFLKSTFALTAFATAAALILVLANIVLFVPPREGLDDEKIATLQSIVRADEFVELDISGIDGDISVVAAYRALDGEDEGMIILEVVYTFRWGTVFTLVAFEVDDAATVAGVAFDRVENDSGYFLLRARYEDFIGMSPGNRPGINEFESQAGATRTMEETLAAVNRAIDFYFAHYQELLEAPHLTRGEPDKTRSDLISIEIEVASKNSITVGDTAEIIVTVTGENDFEPTQYNTAAEIIVTKGGAAYGRDIIRTRTDTGFVFELENLDAGDYEVTIIVTANFHKITETVKFTVHSYDVKASELIRQALRLPEGAIFTEDDYTFVIDGDFTIYTVTTDDGVRTIYTGAGFAGDEFFTLNFTVSVAFDEDGKIYGVGLWRDAETGDAWEIKQGWIDGFFVGLKAADLIPIEGGKWACNDYPDKNDDPDLGEMSGATRSANGFFNAVAAVCVFFAGGN
jgi:hypothetical protein